MPNFKLYFETSLPKRRILGSGPTIWSLQQKWGLGRGHGEHCQWKIYDEPFGLGLELWKGRFGRFCTSPKIPNFTCHYPKISQLRPYVIHQAIYQRSMEIYRHYYYRHHCTYHWSILDYKLLRIYSRVSKFNHAPKNMYKCTIGYNFQFYNSLPLFSLSMCDNDLLPHFLELLTVHLF